MAALAELQRPTIESQSDQLFFEFAVAQLSDVCIQGRPAEDEVYGRSLSAIHWAGVIAVEKSSQQAIHSPEAAQAKAELRTSVNEGLGTDMKLGAGLEVRDFYRPLVKDGHVMSKDPNRSVVSMTDAGLRCAKKKYENESAQHDYRFWPQLTRSEWDHQKAQLDDQMVQGRTVYNTRIVVSPVPEEGIAQSGSKYWDDIGYVSHLKRGFVWLINTSNKEKPLVATLSFDGCNKQRLREVFGKRGIDIPEDEITDNWLKYAITGNMTEEEAAELATAIADEAGDPQYKKNTNTVDLTHEHESVINEVFDESYIHICESLARGRQTTKARELIYNFADNAQHFNERYKTALYRMRANGDTFTDDDVIVLHELLVYSTIEMLRALHINKTEGQLNLTSPNLQHSTVAPVNVQAIEATSFQSRLIGFGTDGARNNRGYSACGLRIAPGNDPALKDLPNDFPGTGLDYLLAEIDHSPNMDQHSEEESDDNGPLVFKCTEGHTNRRRRGELLKVCQTTPCKKGSVGCGDEPKKQERKIEVKPLGRSKDGKKRLGTIVLFENASKGKTDKPKEPAKVKKLSAFALAA